MSTQSLSILTIFSSKEIHKLFKTLLSARQFLYKYKEHIIVGGIESQKHLITDFISNTFDPHDVSKFKLLIESDRGISHAFNKGILCSNNRYILFCNAGDELINIPTLQPNDQIVMPWMIQQKIKGHNKLIVPGQNIKFPNRYVHPGSIISKDIFSHVGLFNSTYKISMDYDLFCRASSNLIRFRYINEAVVIMEPANLSGANLSFKQFIEPILIACRYAPLSLARGLPKYMLVYLYRLVKLFF